MILHAMDDRGKIRRIDEVESGLDCNCVCIDCHSVLVAKKGTERQHHFSHYEKEECEKSAETAAHLISKDVIAKYGCYFPEYSRLSSFFESMPIDYVEKDRLHVKACNVIFDSAEAEIRRNLANGQFFIPDITCSKGGKEVFIEIFVTHAVDEDKLRKIKRSRVSCLEIKIPKGAGYSQIKTIVTSNSGAHKWLYNAKIDGYADSKGEKSFTGMIYKSLSKDELPWFCERAAILEYDAGMPRHTAEYTAFKWIKEFVRPLRKGKGKK